VACSLEASERTDARLISAARSRFDVKHDHQSNEGFTVKALAMTEGRELTTLEVEERIKKLDTDIGRKEADRQALEASIPLLIANHVGSDLAAVRERKQLQDLVDYIEHLKRSREILAQKLEAQREAERVAQRRRDIEASKQAGAALQAEMVEVQSLLVKLGKSLRETIPALEDLFRQSPAVKGLSIPSYGASLGRAVEIALFGLSAGAMPQPKNFSFDPYYVRENGMADLAKSGAEYVGITLRQVSHE
jgi:hypothetical protein